MQDFDLNEFLPQDSRIKAELLEQWGWDGHPVTIANLGRKDYPAKDDKPGESKLQVFFSEFGAGWALECNATQLRKFQTLFGDRTSLWAGQQVILLSVDSKTPQGQPCKTIQVKEVRAAGTPSAPGQPTAPQARPQSAPTPAPAASAPPPVRNTTPPIQMVSTEDNADDPFNDDPATEEQLAKIRELCGTRINPELTSVQWFNVNFNQLTFGEAAAFATRLQQEIDGAKSAQTRRAMTR